MAIELFDLNLTLFPNYNDLFSSLEIKFVGDFFRNAQFIKVSSFDKYLGNINFFYVSFVELLDDMFLRSSIFDSECSNKGDGKETVSKRPYPKLAGKTIAQRERERQLLLNQSVQVVQQRTTTTTMGIVPTTTTTSTSNTSSTNPIVLSAIERSKLKQTLQSQVFVKSPEDQVDLRLVEQAMIALAEDDNVYLQRLFKEGFISKKEEIISSKKDKLVSSKEDELLKENIKFRKSAIYDVLSIGADEKIDIRKAKTMPFIRGLNAYLNSEKRTGSAMGYIDSYLFDLEKDLEQIKKVKGRVTSSFSLKSKSLKLNASSVEVRGVNLTSDLKSSIPNTKGARILSKLKYNPLPSSNSSNTRIVRDNFKRIFENSRSDNKSIVNNSSNIKAPVKSAFKFVTKPLKPLPNGKIPIVVGKTFLVTDLYNTHTNISLKMPFNVDDIEYTYVKKSSKASSPGVDINQEGVSKTAAAKAKAVAVKSKVAAAKAKAVVAKSKAAAVKAKAVAAKSKAVVAKAKAAAVKSKAIAAKTKAVVVQSKGASSVVSPIKQETVLSSSHVSSVSSSLIKKPVTKGMVDSAEGHILVKSTATKATSKSAVVVGIDSVKTVESKGVLDSSVKPEEKKVLEKKPVDPIDPKAAEAAKKAAFEKERMRRMALALLSSDSDDEDDAVWTPSGQKSDKSKSSVPSIATLISTPISTPITSLMSPPSSTSTSTSSSTSSSTTTTTSTSTSSSTSTPISASKKGSALVAKPKTSISSSKLSADLASSISKNKAGSLSTTSVKPKVLINKASSFTTKGSSMDNSASSQSKGKAILSQNISKKGNIKDVPVDSSTVKLSKNQQKLQSITNRKAIEALQILMATNSEAAKQIRVLNPAFDPMKPKLSEINDFKQALGITELDSEESEDDDVVSDEEKDGLLISKAPLKVAPKQAPKSVASKKFVTTTSTSTSTSSKPLVSISKPKSSVSDISNISTKKAAAKTRVAVTEGLMGRSVKSEVKKSELLSSGKSRSVSSQVVKPSVAKPKGVHYLKAAVNLGPVSAEPKLVVKPVGRSSVKAGSSSLISNNSSNKFSSVTTTIKDNNNNTNKISYLLPTSRLSAKSSAPINSLKSTTNTPTRTPPTTDEIINLVKALKAKASANNTTPTTTTTTSTSNTSSTSQIRKPVSPSTIAATTTTTTTTTAATTTTTTTSVPSTTSVDNKQGGPVAFDLYAQLGIDRQAILQKIINEGKTAKEYREELEKALQQAQKEKGIKVDLVKWVQEIQEQRKAEEQAQAQNKPLESTIIQTTSGPKRVYISDLKTGNSGSEVVTNSQMKSSVPIDTPDSDTEKEEDTPKIQASLSRWIDFLRISKEELLNENLDDLLKKGPRNYLFKQFGKDPLKKKQYFDFLNESFNLDQYHKVTNDFIINDIIKPLEEDAEKKAIKQVQQIIFAKTEENKPTSSPLADRATVAKVKRKGSYSISQLCKKLGVDRMQIRKDISKKFPGKLINTPKAKAAYREVLNEAIEEASIQYNYRKIMKYRDLEQIRFRRIYSNLIPNDKIYKKTWNARWQRLWDNAFISKKKRIELGSEAITQHHTANFYRDFMRIKDNRYWIDDSGEFKYFFGNKYDLKSSLKPSIKLKQYGYRPRFFPDFIRFHKMMNYNRSIKMEFVNDISTSTSSSTKKSIKPSTSIRPMLAAMYDPVYNPLLMMSDIHGACGRPKFVNLPDNCYTYSLPWNTKAWGHKMFNKDPFLLKHLNRNTIFKNTAVLGDGSTLYNYNLCFNDVYSLLDQLKSQKAFNDAVLEWIAVDAFDRDKAFDQTGVPWKTPNHWYVRAPKVYKIWDDRAKNIFHFEMRGGYEWKHINELTIHQKNFFRLGRASYLDGNQLEAAYNRYALHWHRTRQENLEKDSDVIIHHNLPNKFAVITLAALGAAFGMHYYYFRLIKPSLNEKKDLINEIVKRKGVSIDEASEIADVIKARRILINEELLKREYRVRGGYKGRFHFYKDIDHAITLEDLEEEREIWPRWDRKRIFYRKFVRTHREVRRSEQNQELLDKYRESRANNEPYDSDNFNGRSEESLEHTDLNLSPDYSVGTLWNSGFKRAERWWKIVEDL